MLSAEDEVYELLEPFAFLGVHTCDLPPCRLVDEAPLPSVLHPRGKISLGAGQLYVPHPEGGVLFVAPTLIVHDVRDHGYRPPEVFVEATRRCPPDRPPRFRQDVRRRKVEWLRP